VIARYGKLEPPDRTGDLLITKPHVSSFICNCFGETTVFRPILINLNTHEHGRNT
jgi:hypothetical protein